MMTDSYESYFPHLFGTPTEPDVTQLKATKRVDAPAQLKRVQPPLSKTEKMVARLLLRGMTEREAAEEIGRSHNTVHVHTRNIYRKLGVSSRKMLYQIAAADPLIVEAEALLQEQRSAAA